MMNRLLRCAALSMMLLISCVAVADDEPPELVETLSRFSQMHTHYRLNDDFTLDSVSEIKVKALSEDVVRRLKERSISYSTSIEQVEVLEAYTEKADGRKIKVPADNYQVTINQGNAGAQAIFSDRSTISIVYPELEKDDAIYMKIKRREKEPMFPEHFSITSIYDTQVAYDDVLAVIDLPAKLQYQFQQHGMQQQIKQQGERRLIQLRFKNPQPVESDRKNFSVWDSDQEVGFSISNFSSYQQVAAAYGKRALPKAMPTERVKKLAAEIVGTESELKTQARLLYEWVASNISYAGNCIGVGAVVPHDTDFILDNRMGDCKDHATLLQALWSAVGIESTQALINSGNSYKLPKVPRASAVNHVINYLPQWQQFVDSTDSHLPFDTLAFSMSDKPVILVEGYQDGMRTPATPQASDRQHVEVELFIQADGRIKGNAKVNLKGRPAVEERDKWREVTAKQEKEWLERVFSSADKPGSGTLIKDDPKPLRSEFNYQLQFERPDFIPLKGAGAFYVANFTPTPFPIYALMAYAQDELPDFDVSCSGGASSEQIRYHFPESMRILAVPEDFEINENHLHIKASYQLEGSTLLVKREINDATPGNICSANLMNRQRKTLIAVREAIDSQIVYQHRDARLRSAPSQDCR